MTESAPLTDLPAGRPPRRRQASIAWQLALAQEFGGSYPFEWDAGSGLITASAGLKALFGLGPDAELSAERVASSVHVDDCARLRSEAETVLRRGGSF